MNQKKEVVQVETDKIIKEEQEKRDNREKETKNR